MTIDQLVFVGLNGYVAALERTTGRMVWSNKEMRRGYVTMLLDGDGLIVSSNGYMYSLDPLTGRILWHKPMKGFGMGAPTSMVSARGSSDVTVVQQGAAHTAASS